MESVMMEKVSAGNGFDAMVHEQLLERRERLREVTEIASANIEFASLLSDVDAALLKFENGHFGECDECDGTVETERLLADPMTRVCLSCLTDQQRVSLEDDLQLAADIQRGLLPPSGLTCDKWHVDYAYHPAGIVSGDYVDIIAQGDEFYFVLGDVSGKGMAASLLMSNLHAMFHSLVPLGLPMRDLMSRANRLLAESSLANQYATLVCGKANRDGEIQISNAGHLPPIVIKGGVKGELNCPGLPLGMFSDAEFAVNEVQLNKGDLIILFSDGATETVSPTGAEFGIDGLFSAINGGPIGLPGETIARCVKHIDEFRGSAQRHDDLTMLAISYTETI
jgi:phosphoserine phosphatase RsbU/P